jgi:NitT/TauT family transport system substrate-binding protein
LFRRRRKFPANSKSRRHGPWSNKQTQVSAGAQTEKHQKRMMDEIAKLLDTGEGKLDPKGYERTVATLMSGGSDPVSTKKPDGAWTYPIYDAMK